MIKIEERKIESRREYDIKINKKKQMKNKEQEKRTCIN